MRLQKIKDLLVVNKTNGTILKYKEFLGQKVRSSVYSGDLVSARSLLLFKYLKFYYRSLKSFFFLI